jgi:DNA-binding XRE family transcriptional regulator
MNALSRKRAGTCQLFAADKQRHILKMLDEDPGALELIQPSPSLDPYLLDEDWSEALECFRAELAAGALIPQFVRERKQLAQSDVKPVTKTDQRGERRVACTSDERVDRLRIQTRCPLNRVLGHVGVFGDQSPDRIAERCVVQRAGVGLSFGWHEAKLYSSPRNNDRAYIGYHRRRQASSPQFGSFSITEATIQQEKLHRLGAAFRELRAERAASVAQVAQRSGVSVERITALEAGALDPDLETMIVLMESLGLRTSDLVLRAEAITKEAAND